MERAAPLWDRSSRLLAIVLALVLGSDLVTLAFAQRWTREIDSLSDRIVDDTAPSIAALAGLRASVVQAELVLSHAITSPGAAKDRAAALDALQMLASDVDRYLSLPSTTAERQHWVEVQRSWTRFDATARDALEQAESGDGAGARGAYFSRVLPSGDRLVASALTNIDFHATNGQNTAARIKWLRHRAIAASNALALLFTVLGIIGIVLLQRQQRAYAMLTAERTRFLEARSEELEQFAGRVAHDIRNPLGTATIAAELVRRRNGDAATRESAERVLRSLARADAIISALLEFARSGARPDPGARTYVRETVLDMVAAFEQEAARSGIEMVVDPIPAVEAACSGGVYLSLVGNLLRNAMKYMGSAPVKRITLRITTEDHRVRTEVIDTGPGIPAAVLPTLFEPWIRGPNSGQSGLGLGLATVKKLAEGHGGSVGVRSRVGEGSTFWFTLPAQPAPDAIPTDASESLRH